MAKRDADNTYSIYSDEKEKREMPDADDTYIIGTPREKHEDADEAYTICVNCRPPGE